MKKQKRKRPYVLKARGEKLAETRARITEAAMRLHEEIGPRHTTISAIAARAGVERLTVYRHFPDDAAVFAACSRHFAELNPPPDPSRWPATGDPAQRTRHGLAELYAYYRRTAPMMEKVYRDADEIPALQRVVREFDAYLLQLPDWLAGLWPRDHAAARRRTILRHAARFSTWRSLERDGIDDSAKVDLLLSWITAVGPER